jgi:hypothetical protein
MRLIQQLGPEIERADSVGLLADEPSARVEAVDGQRKGVSNGVQK